MPKIMGWVSILILHTIQVIMMVMGLEIMDDLRSNQLKASITAMIVVSWAIGGFMTYVIHESLKEPL